MAGKSILMVVTSHDRIDDSHPTGLWFEEFAVPYRLFQEQGYEVAVASLNGGRAPLDPRSVPEHPTVEEREVLDVLDHTLPLAEVAENESFDALFFPGGHGTMYDLPEREPVTHLIEEYAAEDKVIAAICHGPASLIGPKGRDGRPLVAGRHIAAFTNEEESAVHLDGLMPFLLESRLRELGADLVTAPAWSDNVVVDGHLVTGQNPQSSGHAAREVIRLLSS